MPDMTLVDVMFDDGSVLTAILADSIDWAREGDEDDIAFYRETSVSVER